MTAKLSGRLRFFSPDAVSTKTVRRWIEWRELHVHRLGRRIRISEEDFVTFLNKHRS